MRKPLTTALSSYTLVLGAFIGFGCPSDVETERGCEPGLVSLCRCADGSSGEQVCGADHLFGECECELTDMEDAPFIDQADMDVVSDSQDEAETEITDVILDSVDVEDGTTDVSIEGDMRSDAVDMAVDVRDEVADGDLSDEIRDVTEEATDVWLDGDVSADQEVTDSCDFDVDCSSYNCSNGFCAPPGAVYVPTGTFCMGSPGGGVTGSCVDGDAETERDPDEGPLHEVTLTRSFYLWPHEVTQEEWRITAEWWNAQSEEDRAGLTMETAPSFFSACDDCPVEQVSWFDAILYANARSRQEGFPECYEIDYGACSGTPGSGCPSGTPCLGSFSCPHLSTFDLSCLGFRLPTEAEWEYAYRSGTTTTFHNGPLSNTECDDAGLDTIAWYCGNTTTPREVSDLNVVDPREANAWGLYDMSGNVWEWVWDWYYDLYYDESPMEDPLGPTVIQYRIYRGSAYDGLAHWARGANRYRNFPAARGKMIGFRIARSAL